MNARDLIRCLFGILFCVHICIKPVDGIGRRELVMECLFTLFLHDSFSVNHRMLKQAAEGFMAGNEGKSKSMAAMELSWFWFILCPFMLCYNLFSGLADCWFMANDNHCRDIACTDFHEIE